LVSEVRSKLEASKFEKTWVEGRNLSIEEVINEINLFDVTPVNFTAANPPIGNYEDKPATSTKALSNKAFAELTAREIEVLYWLEKGLSNKEIATKLTVSAATINNHLNNIYLKLDVKNRVEASRFARENQLEEIL